MSRKHPDSAEKIVSDLAKLDDDTLRAIADEPGCLVAGKASDLIVRARAITAPKPLKAFGGIHPCFRCRKMVSNTQPHDCQPPTLKIPPRI